MTNYIKRRYGSKKGLLRLYKCNAQQWLFGTYSRFQRLPERIDRVVFVCKGNICRSPLAEEVFRGASSVDVVSFGLDTRSGFPAHPPVVETSLRRGYDLASHQTSFVDEVELRENDLYVCVEPDHARKLQEKIGEKNIVLLGFFGEPSRVYLHDPYSANSAYTESIVEYIISATQNLAAAINNSGVLLKPEEKSTDL